MRIPEVILAAVVAICIFAGCSGRSIEVPEGVEAYRTDDAEAGEISDVFSDVELIPLEFAGEYYPQNFLRLKMTDSLVLIYDMNNRLTVFDNKGKYVSSSNEKVGQGPDEFTICIGFGWNPYSRLIEILGYNKFLFYDKNFNLIKSCKAPNRPGEQIMGDIFDLSANRHILLTNNSKDPRIFLFDSEKGEILKVNNYQEWTIGGAPSAQRNRFYQLPDSGIYCMPLRVTDKILKLNPDSLTFDNAVTVIPGKNSFSKEEFDEMCASTEGSNKLINLEKERPRLMMFNSKLLFQDITVGQRWRDGWYVVADRHSGKMRKLQNYEGETRVFPQIDDIDEEYAYSVVRKETLAESPKLLMNKAEKADSILAPIEEDTYIVLKYKIKE